MCCFALHVCACVCLFVCGHTYVWSEFEDPHMLSFLSLFVTADPMLHSRSPAEEHTVKVSPGQQEHVIKGVDQVGWGGSSEGCWQQGLGSKLWWIMCPTADVHSRHVVSLWQHWHRCGCC